VESFCFPTMAGRDPNRSPGAGADQVRRCVRSEQRAGQDAAMMQDAETVAEKHVNVSSNPNVGDGYKDQNSRLCLGEVKEGFVMKGRVG